MADVYIDTSVALKWVLTEPDSDQARQKSADATNRGDRLFLLDLALIEAANGLAVSVRRGMLTDVLAIVGWLKIKQSPISIVRSEPLFEEALKIALRFKIASYDAAFVAAVQHFDCEGVTADEPLVKAVGPHFPKIRLLKHW